LRDFKRFLNGGGVTKKELERKRRRVPAAKENPLQSSSERHTEDLIREKTSGRSKGGPKTTWRAPGRYIKPHHSSKRRYANSLRAQAKKRNGYGLRRTGKVTAPLGGGGGKPKQREQKATTSFSRTERNVPKTEACRRKEREKRAGKKAEIRPPSGSREKSRDRNNAGGPS